MSFYKSKLPWVIFSLNNQKFAFSVGEVREMVAMQMIVSVPDNPPYFRGVTNLRGTVLPVVDLRKKMGMPGLAEEVQAMIEMLEHREDDHRKWIGELESSVREKRPFSLTTDPHKCAFGKWYDSFRTENLILAFCLKKFDEPHKKVHEAGNIVADYLRSGDFDSALETVIKTKNQSFSTMVGLFRETRNILKETNREILMVLEGKRGRVCVIVDAIESVERINEASIEEKPFFVSFPGNKCILGIGKRRGSSSELVHIIDAEMLFDDSEINISQ